MFRVSTEASFGLRSGAFVLACAIAVLALSATESDARSKRKFFKRSAAATSTADARYADIVVDANSGDVLHSTNPDSIRHPASLTKIMTLYLLFEQLEAGRVKLDSQMEVSAHAASQAPTKLGVRPGQTLMVEDAIKALERIAKGVVKLPIADGGGAEPAGRSDVMVVQSEDRIFSRTSMRGL